MLIENFNLKSTLESGQFFNWVKNEDDYYLSVRKSLIKAENSSSGKWRFTIKEGPLQKDELLEFFNLEKDLRYIIMQFNKDIFTQKAVSKYSGLRVVKQDLFECLVSFIISSNNRIDRIKAIVNKLGEKYGGRFNTSLPIYPFPDLALLEKASVEDFKELGLGYRAKYLYKSIKMFPELNDALLKYSNEKDFENCRHTLLKFPGIGPKVAECIMLYSLSFDNAFPVDVWVKKILCKYDSKFDCNCKNIYCKHKSSFIQEYFNGYAGWAQLYLFHYLRNNSKNYDKISI